MGFNPFRAQTRRRGDIAVVAVALAVVLALVLWAALGDLSVDRRDPYEEVEIRHVQPYQAVKPYRCPGCDHEIATGLGHEVVVPTVAPDLRRHWHSGCWYKEQRRRQPR